MGEKVNYLKELDSFTVENTMSLENTTQGTERKGMTAPA